MNRLAAITFAGSLALAPGAAPAQSAQANESERAPIIAKVFAEPLAFAGKTITIYGLVIEANRSHTRFMLQDVSQQPLAIVGNERVKAKVGDQVIVTGTVRVVGKEVQVVARALVGTRVLGSGGCC